MKNKFFIFILSVLMLLHFVQIAEASGRKLGTSGAAELTIPMGVRSVGLSGSNIPGTLLRRGADRTVRAPRPASSAPRSRCG